MRKIIAVLMSLVSLNAMAQTTAYDISKDDKEGSTSLIFNGPVTFIDLNNESTFTWLKSGHDEYRPAEKVTDYLRSYLKEYKIVAFLGTWCDDSHYMIPKFEKILEVTGYPTSQLTMYGVDRSKTTKNGEHKTYNITLVPTIILYKDGKEAGRMTETVQNSVEADLEAIIEKNRSTNSAH